MGRFIGGRFGDVVDGDAGEAPSSVYSSADQYWMSRNDAWESLPFSATGGAKYTPGNGYIYHLYEFSDGATTLQVTGKKDVDILLIAGGGAGGAGYYSGGGGAGQVVEGVAVEVNQENYNVKVGAGGTGVASAATQAFPGNHTYFGNPTNTWAVIAMGGGAGGSGPHPTASDGDDGGSGGGSSYYISPGQGSALGITPLNPGLPSVPGSWTAYGNDSSTSRGGGVTGAGGGGAGATAATNNGGAGKAFGRWPSSVLPAVSPLNPFMGPTGNYWAGGGGAGPAGGASPYGGGGAAGGASGTDGKDLLGSGGGGTSSPTSNVQSGDGGNGIIVVRYLA